MAEWESGLFFLSLKQSCKADDEFKPASLVSLSSQHPSLGFFLCPKPFPDPVAIGVLWSARAPPKAVILLWVRSAITALPTWEKGCRWLKGFLKVLQERFEFQIADISLVSPSFMLAGLYTASPSHSQLNQSNKDRARHAWQGNACSRGRGWTLTGIWTAKPKLN